ncbi:RDD family protein [Marinobacter sp. 1Y8]
MLTIATQAILPNVPVKEQRTMDDMEYAGFGVRFGAVIIDTVILLVVMAVPLSLIYGEDYWMGTQVVHGVWDVLLSYVLPVVATIWFWRRFLGTPGKMMLKLRVVDARTGDRLSVGQSIGRYLAYFVSTIPFCLGFIWVAFDSRKQGWHDKLAGTVVIRDRQVQPVRFESKP